MGLSGKWQHLLGRVHGPISTMMPPKTDMPANWTQRTLEAVSSTGDTRWQPLKKHHHLRCVQSRETRYALLPYNLLPWIMCEHINANSTLYNTSLVHFKIVVARMSHYNMSLLHFWYISVAFVFFSSSKTSCYLNNRKSGCSRHLHLVLIYISATLRLNQKISAHSTEMTLDWLGVFLVTTVLCKAELQNPAYWFPFSYSRHSHRDRLAVAWCMSLSLSTLSAKWKRMTLWLIYMVMTVISTFQQIKQLNLGSVLFWEQRKSKTFPTVKLIGIPQGLARTFFSCQEN